ncbi:MAG: prevent-host-death protein [Anaerolineales bacterium]|nr:prevent-host-death protein [Anaerolineales bacterium]
MPSQTIDIHAITPDALRELLQANVEIVLVDGQTPLGRVLPIPAPLMGHLRQPGINAGNTTYIADDFDDPLPDEFWFGHE